MTANESTLRLEEELDIETRWTTDSPQYQEALVLMSERQYRRALDTLELLVVQRLFELTKLGLSGTGPYEYHSTGSSVCFANDA